MQGGKGEYTFYSMNNSTKIRKHCMCYQLCGRDASHQQCQHNNAKQGKHNGVVWKYIYYSLEIFHIWRALLFTNKGPFQLIEVPKFEMHLIESGKDSL